MATGNLIFHTGTDWTGGSYTWPIPPVPSTVKVDALVGLWPTPSNARNGYLGFWRNSGLSWRKEVYPNGTSSNLPAPMSKDTTVTEYNLWRNQASLSETCLTAVIEDGGEWTVLFIILFISGLTADQSRLLIKNFYLYGTPTSGLGSNYMCNTWRSTSVTGSYTVKNQLYGGPDLYLDQFRFAIGSIVVTADGVAPDEDPTDQLKLVFTTQPSASTVAGSAFAQQPVVEIRDMDDDLINTATDEVTLSFIGPGAIAGTLTVAAVAGVATFAGLSCDTPGTGLELVATAYGAEPETSSTFAITPAFQLVFTTQPSASTAAGSAFAQQPVVEIRDMDDDLIDTATDDVTLLLNGPGELSGTVTVAAVAGVATFSGLSVNTPGTGLELVAVATGAELETSSAFAITPAFQLVFTTQPSASTVAGSAFAQQPVVEIRDMDDDLIDTATDEVTISLADGDGVLACTLTDEDGNKYEGTLTVAAVAGVATFTGLSIDTAGADKVLAVSAEYAEPEESDTFAITAPQTLAFATQPSASTAAGVAFAQQPAVEIKDNTGSRNTSATDDVTLLLFSDAGSLAGTATVAAVDGLATFSGLAVDAAGSVNTLMAVCDAAESVESDNFEIT